jgi:hypothetical protein
MRARRRKRSGELAGHNFHRLAHMREAALARTEPPCAAPSRSLVTFLSRSSEAIRSGRLPIAKPERTFGGQSSGGTCAVCGDQVERDDVEFEVEFKRHGATPGLDRSISISGASPRGNSSAPRSRRLSSPSHSFRSYVSPPPMPRAAAHATACAPTRS